MTDSYYQMSDMCAMCGERYGQHVGLSCCNSRGSFFLPAKLPATTDSYHFAIEPEPRAESTKGTFEVHADGSVSGVSLDGDAFHYPALRIACHSGGLEGYIIALTYGGYRRRNSIAFPSGATLKVAGDKIVSRVGVTVTVAGGSGYSKPVEPKRAPLPHFNQRTEFDAFPDYVVFHEFEPVAPLHTSPTTDSAYPAIAGLLRG